MTTEYASPPTNLYGILAERAQKTHQPLDMHHLVLRSMAGCGKGFICGSPSPHAR